MLREIIENLHWTIIADIIKERLISRPSFPTLGQTTADFVSSSPDHLRVMSHDHEIIIGRAIRKVLVLQEPCSHRKCPMKINKIKKLLTKNISNPSCNHEYAKN